MKRTITNLVYAIILILIIFIAFTGIGIMSDSPIVLPWHFYIWLLFNIVTLLISFLYSHKNSLVLMLPLISLLAWGMFALLLL